MGVKKIEDEVGAGIWMGVNAPCNSSDDACVCCYRRSVSWPRWWRWRRRKLQRLLRNIAPTSCQPCSTWWWIRSELNAVGLCVYIHRWLSVCQLPCPCACDPAIAHRIIPAGHNSRRPPVYGKHLMCVLAETQSAIQPYGSPISPVPVKSSTIWFYHNCFSKECTIVNGPQSSL